MWGNFCQVFFFVFFLVLVSWVVLPWWRRAGPWKNARYLSRTTVGLGCRCWYRRGSSFFTSSLAMALDTKSRSYALGSVGGESLDHRKL